MPTITVDFNLKDILESLRKQPRPCTIEENIYLHYLGEKIAKAKSSAEIITILRDEGTEMDYLLEHATDNDVMQRLVQVLKRGAN